MATSGSIRRAALALAVTLATAIAGLPQLVAAAPSWDVNPAPNRKPGEGAGPFHTLVIRGVTLIDGTGAPPVGPVDVVIHDNRISEILEAGTPGLPLNPGRPPFNADHEIDATGQYLLPGFVDVHTHGGDEQGARP